MSTLTIRLPDDKHEGRSTLNGERGRPPACRERYFDPSSRLFGLDELAKINHILISHSHLDHVLSIGLLADSVARRRVDAPPIRVHALQATLEALRAHIFNGVIWPDFTRLPSAEHPILAFERFAIGDVLTFGRAGW